MDELVEAVTSLCELGVNYFHESLRQITQLDVSEFDLPNEHRAVIDHHISALLDDERNWADFFNFCVFMSSLLMAYGSKQCAVRYTTQAFRRCSDTQKRSQILWQLRNFIFRNGIDPGYLLNDLFFEHYNDWFEHFPKPVFQTQPGRCIVLIGLFLQPPHAPTIDTLAKAAILRDEFGYDVAIVNTHEIPTACDLPFLKQYVGKRRKDLGGLQTVHDEKFGATRLFTPSEEMPSDEGYISIIDFVEYWKPEFILNYGAFNFSAEYLGQGVKVITMPAGTELLPTRNSQYDVCFHPFGDKDREMIKRYGMENVGIIETLYNYDMPKCTTTHKRSDFALDESDFVIAMVGTRLSTEIGDENIDIMRDVLAIDPRIKIVLAGELKNGFKEKLLAKLPEDRLRLPGSVNDIPAFYDGVVDLYLNPLRTGGGTSASYALGCGLPTFTLNQGHVSHLTHPDFVFDTRENLLAAIGRALDPAERESLKKTAREGFERIGSRSRMVREILTGAKVVVPAV